MDVVTAAIGIAACVLLLVREHRKHEAEEAREACAEARAAAFVARHEAATWRPAHVERRVHVLFEPDRGTRRLDRVMIVCAQDEPGLDDDRLWVRLDGRGAEGPFMAVWCLRRAPDGEWVIHMPLEGAAAEEALASLAGDVGGAVRKIG